MPYDVVAFENDELALLLTPDEEGIFHRMLRKAWMNGSVPADLKELAYLCRVNPRTMRKVWPKLAPLWSELESNSARLISKKLERERKFLEDKRNLASMAGKASAKARQIKQEASTDVQQDSSTSHPSPPLPNPTIKEEGKEPLAISSPSGFVRFWQAYPKKKSKGHAQKVWTKLKLDTKLMVILAAVEQQRTWQEWLREHGQFIPHPASWLNHEGWLNEPDTPIPANGNGHREPTPEERAAAKKHWADMGITK